LFPLTEAGTSSNSLIGLRQIPAVADLGGASTSGSRQQAVDQLLATGNRRKEAELLDVPVTRRSRGAFVDAAFSSLDNLDSALDSFLEKEEDMRAFVV
jgi:hypothetical protein